MLAGIREILIISTPQDTPRFEQLLGDGSQWGMNLQYAVQPSPDGLAQAFLIGEQFLAAPPAPWCWATTSSTATTSTELLAATPARDAGASVFAYHVQDPSATAWPSSTPPAGAVAGRKAQAQPKSTTPSPACTSTTPRWSIWPKASSPAPRGELEITDLNRLYLEQAQLNVEIMGRGYAWLDTGTHESLLEAGPSSSPRMEHRQGLKIACPEEIAWRHGWIDAARLEQLAQPLAKNGYGQYLQRLLRETVY